MQLLQNAYLTINKKEHLSDDTVFSILNNNEIQNFQKASLAANIFFNDFPNEAEVYLVKAILNELPSLEECWDVFLNKKNENSFESDLLTNVFSGEKIGKAKIQKLVNQITTNKVNKIFLSVLLMTIKHKSLNRSDMFFLTNAMGHSGNIYDYRNKSEINFRKIIRRYPTGALSEKIALIMPSLLMAFANSFPICAPFLVAKSLSYTGGTWDKLLSITGFYFPKQGTETMKVLRKANVAMTVTENDFNPADRFLYQFRSVTNTVESHELIVSSIASKQIGVPSDSLIMDIRYGEGAFLKDLNEAEKLNNDLKSIMNKHDIKYKGIFTDTYNLYGSTVGNYWEVLEAIVIMKNKYYGFGFSFQKEGIEKQKELVVEMTSELICLEFPENKKEKIKELAYQHFRNGRVFKCFLKLLKSHNVSKTVIQLIHEGKSWINVPFVLNKIVATKKGFIKKIKQKEIGSFVNFELGGGFNELFSNVNPYSGMILLKQRNELVEKGELLAIALHTSRIKKEFLDDNKYFYIED